MRIFVDNCVSHVIASTLNGYVAHLGHDVVHIRDMPCGPDAADVVWINALQASGNDWLVLTGDIRISKNRPERLAFRQANLKGIALAPGYQTFRVHQQASMLLWRWPDIDNLIRNIAPPFLCKVSTSRGGRFEMLTI